MERLRNLFVGPAHIYTVVAFFVVTIWVLQMRGIRMDVTGAKTIGGLLLFVIVCRLAWDEGYASTGWGGMSILVPLGAAAAGAIWFYPGPSNGFWWWFQVVVPAALAYLIGWRAALTGAEEAPPGFDPNF